LRSLSNATRLVPMNSPAMRVVSSAVSIGTCSIFTGTSWPLSSTCGGRPGEKMRSLTFFETRSMAESSAVVGKAALAAAAGAAGTPVGGVPLGGIGGVAMTSS